MESWPKYLVIMKAGCGNIIDVTTKEIYRKFIKRDDISNFTAIKIAKRKIDGKEKLWINIKRVLPNNIHSLSLEASYREEIAEVILEERAILTRSNKPSLFA